MEDILTVILIFGGGACIAMAFSPIGRAVADRIRGKSASAGGGDLRTELAEQKDALDQELEAVRREVAELAERMDFAERLRSEEHTSELQSRLHLVCRLLLEKKKKTTIHEA